MILGIDLCKKYAQVSIYNKKDVTVDTPCLLKCDNSYNVPLSICKKKGQDMWYIGDEQIRLSLLSEGVLVDSLLEKLYAGDSIMVDNVSVTPVELLEKYMANLIELAIGNERIDRLCVCCDEYNITVLDSLKKVFDNLGIDREVVNFINKQESLMYYVLSQKREIWYGDVAIFDFKESGLETHLLTTKKNGSSEIVKVEDFDFANEMPYFKITTEEQKINVGQMLTNIAEKMFDKRIVSAVFLTGIGFDYDFQFDNFIKYICNKRRVFAGQNLYSKGACYCAMELDKPGDFQNRVLICKDKLMYELDLEITERGKDSRLRILHPGTNWYTARKKYDFFVEGTREVVLHKTDSFSKEKEVITINLDEFPIRPNKATKIGIGFDFTPEGKCIVTIKDRGFGSFYKSSGKMICREI